MNWTESCQCGAEVVIEDPTNSIIPSSVQDALSGFRRDHKHEKPTAAPAAPSGPVPF